MHALDGMQQNGMYVLSNRRVSLCVFSCVCLFSCVSVFASVRVWRMGRSWEHKRVVIVFALVCSQA